MAADDGRDFASRAGHALLQRLRRARGRFQDTSVTENRPTTPIAGDPPSTSSRAAKYHTIVADPAWDHSDGTGLLTTRGFTTRVPLDGHHPTSPPYAAMSLEEIAALPVSSLADRDAHLYLWTTNRYLRSVWDVAEAWGFRGVCVLAWCKKPIPAPMGGAFRSNLEFCLFARRGDLPTIGTIPSRWFPWPRRRGAPVALGQRRQTMHSAKPEAFLDMVETVSPGPYLELFARRQRLGWDTWGDEALNHVGRFEDTA